MTPRRMSPHQRVVAAALALGVLALGGCGNPVDAVTGGDPIKDYCAALSSDRRAFAEMVAENSPTALVTHLSMLRELESRAPDDIADDWQVFVQAVQGLSDALRNAGVAPGSYHNGKPPSGLDAADRRAIRGAADHLSSTPVVQAAGTISQEATDVCKINLGM